MAREGGADLSAIAKKYKSKSGPEKKSDSKNGEVPGRTFEELLAAARTISKDDIEGIEQLIAETLKINSIRRETIYSALKDSTGYTLTAIRKQRSELSEAIPSLDQLDLAHKTISRLGADNILHSSGLTWLWEDVGVWKTMEDRTIKQSAQRVIEDEKMDVTAHLVNGVCDVLKSEINDPRQEFNLGNPETVNCLNGQLELEDDNWQSKPHKKEEYRTTQIPVVYDNAATAPKFLQFISEIFCSDPDKDDKVECILQMMGYTLMSHSQREKFIMLIGNIAMTGVMSRHVVTLGALFLILCGLFPKLGAIITTIPIEVLGGSVIVMFGMIAAAGVSILSDVNWTRRNLVIFAISLSIGLGLQLEPNALNHLPGTLKILLNSGLLPAATIAIVLNLILPEELPAEATEDISGGMSGNKPD